MFTFRSNLVLVLRVLALGACIACRADVAPGLLVKSPPIRISRTEDQRQATLTYHESSALLALSIAPGDKSAAPLAMSQRVELWRPLVKNFLAARGHRSRYFFSVDDYPELGPRMAVAAVESGKWNGRSGRPASGSAEDFVRALLETRSLFAELDALWEPFGYRIFVHSVENVTQCHWRDIEAAGARAHSEVPADAIVPCGGAILFELKPTDKSS